MSLCLLFVWVWDWIWDRDLAFGIGWVMPGYGSGWIGLGFALLGYTGAFWSKGMGNDSLGRNLYF